MPLTFIRFEPQEKKKQTLSYSANPSLMILQVDFPQLFTKIYGVAAGAAASACSWRAAQL
jgi:hypothetical protein